MPQHQELALARKSHKPGKKKYPVTKCAAWMSANASGRLITEDDYRWDHKAYAPRKKRVRLDSHMSELRRRRQNARHIGRKWNPKAERTALALERRAAHWQEWESRWQATQQSTKTHRAALTSISDSVAKFAATPESLASRFSDTTSKALFRAPLAAGTLEPLRVRAACWVPDLRQSACPSWPEPSPKMHFNTNWIGKSVTLP